MTAVSFEIAQLIKSEAKKGTKFNSIFLSDNIDFLEPHKGIRLGA
jgi:hypothetical protein